ncbi:hypothetical protein [Kineococcus rhizosphaerae]|uniref:hypothetical protein n=1 Tax=Kineococcus rhizosphaerae TaxID=559628 RepID=UPI00147655DD|nr:hypothetical protein [Kineococcus rhizosphaerae]
MARPRESLPDGGSGKQDGCRAQARALRAGGGSVPEIAELFGVTRQRTSALLEPERDAG